MPYTLHNLSTETYKPMAASCPPTYLFMPMCILVKKENIHHPLILIHDSARQFKHTKHTLNTRKVPVLSQM